MKLKTGCNISKINSLGSITQSSMIQYSSGAYSPRNVHIWYQTVKCTYLVSNKIVDIWQCWINSIRVQNQCQFSWIFWPHTTEQICVFTSSIGGCSFFVWVCTYGVSSFSFHIPPCAESAVDVDVSLVSCLVRFLQTYLTIPDVATLLCLFCDMCHVTLVVVHDSGHSGCVAWCWHGHPALTGRYLETRARLCTSNTGS